MSFSERNFPGWWDIHNSRASHITRHRGNLAGSHRQDGRFGIGRSLVADWARIGAADVTFNGGETFVRTQIDNTALCDWKLLGYSYPLSSNSNPIQHPSYAKIAASKILEKLNRLNSVLHANKTLHTRMPTLAYNKIEKALVNNYADEDLFALVKELPPSLYNTIEHNLDVIEEKFVNSALSMVDSMYSNNIAMPHTQCSENIPIFYLTGSKMTKVASCLLNVQRREINSLTENWFNLPDSFSSDIYGINLCSNDQRLVVRRKKFVDIYSREDQQPLSLTFKTKIYSSFPNDFIPEQTLVTFNGALILVSGHSTLTKFYIPMTTNSSRDIWTWAEFANHSSQFYYTDRSQCVLFDARCFDSGCGKPSQYLFDIERAPVNSKEHLYHFKQLYNHNYDSCYFLLSTNFNSFVLDRRMPRHPVLQWTNPLLHPCVLSYSICKDNLEHLFIGSQRHREAAYLNLSFLDNHQTIQMKGPSLSFSDISLGPANTYSEQDNSTHDRLVNSSIIGLSGALIDSHRCISIRLTSWGDLFAQEAKLNPSQKDKDDINSLLKERCASWLNSSLQLPVVQTEDLNDSTEDMFSQDLSQLRLLRGIDMNLKKHVSCGFCQPDPVVVTSSVINDTCSSCGTEIKIWAYNSPDLLKDNTEDYRELLPSVYKRIPHTALSRRLDYLWNHDFNRLLDKKMIKKFIKESDDRDQLFVSYCKYTRSKSFKLFNLRRRLLEDTSRFEWENFLPSYYRSLSEDLSSIVDDKKDSANNDELFMSNEDSSQTIWKPSQETHDAKSKAFFHSPFSNSQPIFTEDTRPTFQFDSSIFSQPVVSKKRPLSTFDKLSIQSPQKTPRLDSLFSQSQSKLF